MSNGIMDNPGDAKYGFTHEQIIEGFGLLKEKGGKVFRCPRVSGEQYGDK